MVRSLAAIGLGLSVLDGLSCGPILFEGLGGHQYRYSAKTPNLSGATRRGGFAHSVGQTVLVVLRGHFVPAKISCRIVSKVRRGLLP